MATSAQNITSSVNRAPGAPRPARPTDTGELNPIDDFVEYARNFAQQRPDLAALWCFGIGFVVGWKLKPW
jgi:hypothetical protein